MFKRKLKTDIIYDEIEFGKFAMPRYVYDDYISASGAFVGLAKPGDAGSWQRECKVAFANSFFFG